ncbi:MAG: hypothetical protein AAF567_23265 [Actinomycetota bacterium]
MPTTLRRVGLDAYRHLRALLSFLLNRFGRLGFGRQAALAAARRAFPARAHTPTRRAASLFAGSLFIGIGVALLQQADLGLSPYDVLVSGLTPRLGLSFGQTVWVVSATLFSIAALLGQFPSRWGIAYVLTNGLAIDAVSGFINAPESLAARWLFVALSLAAICSGVSLVVHSGSTGGAFELLMRAGELRGADRRVVRTSLEVAVLTLGIALGGSFGLATVVIALTIGPLLGLTMQVLADHSRGRLLRQLENAPESRHPSTTGAR